MSDDVANLEQQATVTEGGILVAPKLMPFGKYRGTPIAQLPGDYIDFLLRKCENLGGELRQTLVEELYNRTLGRRFDEALRAFDLPDAPPRPDANDPDAVRLTVDRWFRELVAAWAEEPVAAAVLTDAHQRLVLALGLTAPPPVPAMRREVRDDDIPF